MKYRVLYRSVGLLTGYEPGDTVELDSVDAARLLSFGLVSPLSGPAEQPTAGPKETKRAAEKVAEGEDDKPRQPAKRK